MSDQYADIRSLPLLAVLSALGFSDWKVRKNGQEHYGKCPVHQAVKNNTAFSFHQDGRYQCFSCGLKGKGSIDLVMAIKACNFRDAVEFLKGIDSSAIQAAPVGAESAATENAPFKGSYEKFAVESAWLKERGFTDETLKRFGVFEYFNPKRESVYKGRIMLPIRRFADGELVGYLARTKQPAEGEPKYIFPKGFQKHLEVFGSWQIKNDGQRTPLRYVYVVESPFACMKFWQFGLHAVSCFGWHVSPEQASILSSLARGVVYCPDRNKRRESLPIASELSRVLWTKSPDLPDGVDDPEDLSVEQIRALT